MNRVITAAALLTSTATAALAGGLDRSGQPIGIIFEDGNYAELSFGHAMTDVSGTDVATTASYGDVSDDFFQFGAGVKYQFNDKVSFALILDQPFGADVFYPADPTTPLLAGTSAQADSTSLTGVARYEFNENFSVHGGIRYQRASGNITLSGLAYGPLDGYNVDLADDDAFGYVVGVAYEKPEIALRVALTYNSEITHDFDTVESVGAAIVNPGSVTEISTPASWNLDFQSGIAEDTLIFGSVRRAMWSDFIISPAFFAGATGGGSISDLTDSTAYSLGVGRRFNDKLSGSISIGYEPADSDNLVSPLAPTNGNKSIALGLKYAVSDEMAVSGGVRYTKLGDAFAETGTPDTARGDFRGNDVLSVGVKIGYSF